MTRKSFFIRLGRYCFGLILGMGSAVLLIQKRIRLRREDHVCSGGGICRGCGKLDKCPLPSAVGYRHSGGEKPFSESV